MKRNKTSLLILIATLTIAFLTDWYILSCVAVILASTVLLINSISILVKEYKK